MKHSIDPDHLTELLESAARRTDVGPPPLAALSRDATRARRRRTAVMVASSAAAVVLAVGATTLLPTPGEVGPGPTATGPHTSTPTAPVTNERLVGLGHVVVAVPETWGTNDTRCGVPIRDTVLVDVVGVDLCLIARPAGIESVEITTGPPSYDVTPGESVVLDGVEALRQAVRCRSSDERSLCSAWLYVPSEDVSVRAESSSGPDEVDRILDGVRILPDRLGVPGFSRIADRSPQGGSGERYADLLTRSGLRAVTRGVSRPRLPPGYVLSAEPAPGTVVEPGTAVVVTVVADR